MAIPPHIQDAIERGDRKVLQAAARNAAETKRRRRALKPPKPLSIDELDALYQELRAAEIEDGEEEGTEVTFFDPHEDD